MICLALRSRFVKTSPSLTRVNHRSKVLPGPPKADFRLEMISRFLLSGDQTGLKSAAGVLWQPRGQQSHQRSSRKCPHSCRPPS